MRLPPGNSTATGEAMQYAGRKLQQVGAELEQARQIEKDRADTLRAEAAFNGDLNRFMDLADGPDGFKHIKGAAILNRDVHGEYLSRFDELVKQSQSTLANERQRGKHKQRADYARLQFRRDLLGHVGREGEIASKEVYDNSLRLESRNAASHWQEPMSIMVSLTRLNGLVDQEADRSGWTDEKRAFERLRVGSEAHASVVEQALVNDDYAYGKSYFERVQKELDPETSARIQRALNGKQREIEAEARQKQALARVDVLERERDEQASLRATGNYQGNRLTRQEYVAAYGPDEGAKRYDRLQKYWAAGSAVQDLALANPQQRAEILAKYRPAPTEGFAENAQVYGVILEADREQQKAREDDPAGYLTRYMPSVQRAYEDMARAPDDFEAARNYARQVQAGAAQLGIESPAVLPAPMAKAIVTGFYDQKAGGEPAALRILGEKEKWGDQWPAVWQQLAPDLPGAAFVIGMGMSPEAGRRLAEVSGLDPQTGKPITLATLRDTLPAGEAPKVIADDVRAELNDAILSYAGQPGADKMASTLLDSAERLAIRYRATGKSAGEAAEQAAREVFNERYEFIERDDATIRVPVQYDADAVKGALRIVTSELSTQPRIDESQWTTLPDDSGVALTWMGGLAEGPDGQPIVYTWEQLLNRGATARRALDDTVLRPGPSYGSDAR